MTVSFTMEKFILLIVWLFCALSPLSMVAQTEYQIPESLPANNGELDWLIYKDNNGEVKIDKKEIVLKSNTKALYVNTVAQIQPSMTYSDAPISFDGNFYMSATMKPSVVDEKHLFGLVFGVANESNYCAIVFDNQFCYLIRVYSMMGLTYIQGLDNRIRYKYPKNKGNEWTISIERKNQGDWIFSVNGLEVMTHSGEDPFSFAYTDMERAQQLAGQITGHTLLRFIPAIGACVTNKGEVKITKVAYEQWAAPADVE